MTQPDPNTAADRTHRHAPDCLPKLCGADIELGNFIVGSGGTYTTGHTASSAVLQEIRGVAHAYAYTGASAAASPQTQTRGAACAGRDWDGQSNGWAGRSAVYSSDRTGTGDYGSPSQSQDWGRKFLPSNGACVYIDLGHLEVCLPECLSASDFVAAGHAMLRVVQDALQRANSRQIDGRRIVVTANNSDGHGSSWGSHMNLLVTRRCFNNLFHHRLQLLLWLASHQVSSIVYTGAGKVGSENGRPAVDFQLSQRADFFETITGEQTTFARPIVNSRDESLCGRAGGQDDLSMARLHIIFYDHTLCHVSTFLRVGVGQIVAAMIEQGYIQPGLILDSPLLALQRWTRDVTLRQKARLIGGQEVTAVELQLAIADLAGAFVAAGRAEGIVPQAGRILALWTETLEQLRDPDRNREALAGKLDWVLKRQILETAAQKGIGWPDPQMQYLDQMYSNLDPREGLYWQMEAAGVVQRLVTDGQVERFVHEPPSDTRAYTRARVLQGMPEGSILHVDWDTLRIQTPPQGGRSWAWAPPVDLPLHNPLGFTRSEFDEAAAQSASLLETLERMIASQANRCGPLMPDACQGPVLPAPAPGAGEAGSSNPGEPSFEGDPHHGHATEET